MKIRNDEQWRHIDGFDDKYMVSSYGRIKSLSRKKHLPNGGTCMSKEKILSPGEIKKNGYLIVYLRKDGKPHRFYVHRIVAEAFIGKSNQDVNHIDGNKQNNNIKNLEYCSRSENMLHSFRVLGQNCRKVDQFSKGGEFIKRWNNAYEVYDVIGVNRGNINSCINGKRKTAGGFIWKGVSNVVTE